MRLGNEYMAEFTNLQGGSLGWEISGHKTLKPMTLVYKLVLRFNWREKKSQDLDGNRTYDHHNSSVAALPLRYQALGSKKWWGISYLYTSQGIKMLLVPV